MAGLQENGGGRGGCGVIILYLIWISMPSSRPAQQNHIRVMTGGVYLGVGTKGSKDKQVKLKEGGGFNSRSGYVKGCGAKHEDGSSPLLMSHKSAWYESSLQRY